MSIMDELSRDDHRLLNAEGSRVGRNLYKAVDEYVLYSVYDYEQKRDFLKQMVDRVPPKKSPEEMDLDIKRQVLELRAKEIMGNLSRVTEEFKEEALKQIFRGGSDEKAK